MSQRIKLCLAVSVILNVLLVGVLLGDLLRHFIWQNDSHRTVAELIGDFSPDKRKLVEDTLHTAWSDMDAARAQIAEAKKEAARLLTAEPFDEQRYLTQVQHLNDLHRQMRLRMATTMATLAKQLSPQERSRLADIVAYPPAGNPSCASTTH